MNVESSRPPKASRSRAPRLVLTGVVLLGLAASSWALSYVPLGSLAMPVALALAALKALTIAWAFMHWSHEGAASRLVGVVTVAMMLLFAGLVAADVGTRAAPPRQPAGVEPSF